ncbi:unnamed protein product [Rhodiola kirilowii]
MVYFLGLHTQQHIVQIYSYQGDDLRNHLEIEAHTGSVNDLAFSYPNKTIVCCHMWRRQNYKSVGCMYRGQKFSFEAMRHLFIQCVRITRKISSLFSQLRQTVK